MLPMTVGLGLCMHACSLIRLQVFSDQSSLEAALEAFRTWDDLAHDAAYGGYLEAYSM